ncbi:MAG: ribosome biogenesis GTP-binding protein YihA/YsxC [Campylobacter sp.]|nr:ribosome biogenesis GTP-binding protein YihA/YsxC [Campylobacter sp.]
MIHCIGGKFLNSSPSIKLSPDFGMSEIVFLGRSNVGKSSLINAITNNKNLAKCSQTPGKTRLINFFEIDFKNDENDEKFNLIFVDLPGFGYAKVAKSMQNEWKSNLDEFLKARQSIKLYVHLIDSRHFDLQIDENLSQYLDSFIRKDQKILNIYTKADKLNQKERSALLKHDPKAILVSTTNKKNLDEVVQSIVNGALGL